MKRTIFTGIFAFFMLLSASAQVRIIHGPYLCDMTEDAVTVVWVTDKPAMSWVELAPADERSFYSEEHPKYYETLAGRRLTHKTLHRIRLTGLEPGTGYSYRIFSQEILERGGRNEVQYGRHIASSNVYSRRPYSFRTLGPDGSNLSFLVLNDMHENPDKIGRLLQHVEFEGIDLVAFNGDMVSTARSEDQLFTSFMDTCTVIFATGVPVLMNRGNHETRGPFADMLMDYFPTADGRYYGHYRIGDTSILLIDSGEDKPDSDIEYGGVADFDAYIREEARWLAEMVESKEFTSSKRRIVLMHIPPDDDTWYGTLRVKELFLPLLERAGIDLMISGHTHRYAFLPAEEGRNFPVLINDHNSLLRCDIVEGRIRLTVTGYEGEVKHVHEL